MPVLKLNPAIRHFIARFVSMIAVYVLVSLAIIHYLVRSHPTGPILYVLAVLPAIPIIGSIVVVGLYLSEEKDEFLRTVFERSLLWGMGGTLAMTSTCGFLEMFAHVHLTSRYVSPLFWVFPFFWIFTAIASAGLRVHYRSRCE